MTPLSTSKPQSSSAPDWRLTLLPVTATTQQAIACLDRSGLQIVLVQADDGRLVGTITDGDIRRGLLRGLSLADSIQSIVHRTPLVVPAQVDRETARSVMAANRIRQLPVVDAQHRVIGLHCWDDAITPASRPNTMVVMAGGKGTRLRPHTEACPKPLLPVAGKPMLLHILERAKAEGIQRFLFAIHYLGHMIEEYFDDGRRWGVEIGYLRESMPLGTAGALSLMTPQPQDAIIVTNGDVLTDIRYGELLDFHERHAAAGTMAVKLHEWQHPFGVVRTEGIEITGFEEKPVTRNRINAGIYALAPRALALLAADEPCDMPSLFARLIQHGERTVAYPMHEPWLDVGRPDDYKTAQSSESDHS